MAKTTLFSGIGAVLKLKETIIREVNQAVQDYCETTDVSQLSVSLWAGDVVLKDLQIKTTAVETLANVPVKVVVGRVGVLAIKIPWASIFRNPVEVTIKDFYVLLNPSYTVYDKEAEERISLILKKSVVQKIEDHYKEYLISKSTAGGKPKDTYLEKCAIQIIRNMQIKLESFHLRYEDNKITKPSHSFSFGLTLDTFTVQATDSNWTPNYISKNTHTEYKLGLIEGWAVYWNIKTSLISTTTNPTDKEELVRKLAELRKGNVSKLKYVIGPIKGQVKVMLTPNPEKAEFKFPTFSIDAVLNELAIDLSNLQLRDLITLAETLEFIARNQRYKKYKPKGLRKFAGNYKIWWKFAFNCIMEEVHRKKTNWSWRRIAQHRALCKSYIDLYYKKVTSKSPIKDLEDQIDDLELSLDVFNIILCRKLVRLRQTRLEKIESSKKPGWLMSWFTNYNLSEEDMSNILSEQWTAEEKAQLKEAVDYRETNEEIEYPADYESVCINFQIRKMSFVLSKLASSLPPQMYDQGQRLSNVSPNLNPLLNHGKRSLGMSVAGTDEIYDDHPYHTICRLIVLDFQTAVASRPVNGGLKVSVNLKKIEARGFQEKSQIIVSTTTKSVTNFFDLLIETMPLNCESGAEKRIKLSAQRLQFNYNWKTFAEIADVFALPQDVELHELQAVAVSKLEEFKEFSTSSFQQFIVNKTEVELFVDFVAPYIVLPQNGELDKKSNYLVFDLGELHIRSQPRVVNVTAETPLEGLFFDTYTVQLKEFRVFLFLPGEPKKRNYLLKYNQMSLTVKCSFLKKGRSSIRVDGELPSVDGSFSQRNLCKLLHLIVTLPLPPSLVDSGGTRGAPSESVLLSETKAISRLPFIDFEEKTLEKSFKFGDASQLADFSVFIHIQTVRVLANQSTGNGLLLELLSFSLSVRRKIFFDEAHARVEGARLILLKGENSPARYLVKTPMPRSKPIPSSSTDSTSKESQNPLFSLKVTSASPTCPRKLLPSVATAVRVEITRLDINLYEEAVATVFLFIEGFANDDFQNSIDLLVLLLQNPPSPVTRIPVKLRFVGSLGVCTLQLSTDSTQIMRFQMRQIVLKVEEVTKVMVISVTFEELAAFSVDSESLYRQLLTVSGPKVFDLALTFYKSSPESPSYGEHEDLKLHLVIGSIRFVVVPALITYIKNSCSQLLVDRHTCKENSKEDVQENERALSAQNSQHQYRIYSIKDVPKEGRKLQPINDRKIILDIQIEPASITFPQEKTSPDAIRLNLGQLTFQNRFLERPTGLPEATILIDALDFCLNDTTISRVFIDLKTEKTLSQIFLVNPISFDFNVERKMTRFCTLFPDLALVGHMHNNLIRLSTQDYSVTAAIIGHILKPLAESSSSSPQAGAVGPSTTATRRRRSTSPVSGIRTKIDLHPISNPSGSSKVNSDTDPQSDNISGLIKQQTLKLSVRLDHFEVILFTGKISLEKKLGTVEHPDENKLATFSLRNISGSCNTWNNGDIIAELTVGDIMLTDSRVSSLATRGQQSSISVIVPSVLRDPPPQLRPFLVITFKDGTVKDPNDSNLHIHTPGLSLNIFSEFLMEVSNFFTIRS